MQFWNQALLVHAGMKFQMEWILIRITFLL